MLFWFFIMLVLYSYIYFYVRPMQEFGLQELKEASRREEIAVSLSENNDVDILVPYTSDFQNAKILREFIDDLCKAFWVSPKWRTRLVLIVDELNNNAIEYGSKSWDINKMYIYIERKSESDISITARVIDAGTGERAKKAKDMEELRKEHEQEDFSCHSSIRWRGLFLIISRLVDGLSFSDDQDGWWLIVQVEKHLSQDS